MSLNKKVIILTLDMTFFDKNGFIILTAASTKPGGNIMCVLRIRIGYAFCKY